MLIKHSSVNYKIPKSSHLHKSMLLRGVKFATPMLNSGDVRAVQGRAQHSGRSFGGAPLNGRGRGGRMDYSASDRPNPFAAHLDPRFMQAPPSGMPMRPPGWVPPGQGGGDFSRGPPPPQRGGHQYHNQGYQQYPQQGYQGQGGYGGNYNNYENHDSRGGRGSYRGNKPRGRGDHSSNYRGGGGYGRY